jgi:hypothetical protein
MFKVRYGVFFVISVLSGVYGADISLSGTVRNTGNAPILAVPSIRGSIDIKEMNCMRSALWLPVDSNGTSE